MKGCYGDPFADKVTQYAPLTVDEGADTAVWLATLGEEGHGGYFRERKVYCLVDFLHQFHLHIL